MRGAILRAAASAGMLAGLLAGLAGCNTTHGLPAVSRPSARVVSTGLKDIGLQDATVMLEVEVTNPYSVPLPLANMDYALASAGQTFLAGKADLQGTVPAGGARTVSVPAKVSYRQLLGVLKEVKLGAVVPYDARLGLSVNAPSLGMLRLPLSYSGELPVPAPPQASVTDLRWGHVDSRRAEGTVTMNLVNRNQFAVQLTQVDYALTLGGVAVSSGSLPQAVNFDANGGAGQVQLPFSVSPDQMPSALAHMVGGRTAPYSLQGTISLGTRFGPIRLPINQTAKPPAAP